MTSSRSVQRLLSLHDHTDTAALGHLAAHRVLTTSQLARLLERPQRTVEYRMARLREAGYVLGERPPRRTGSAPFHWSLTASGLAFVTGTRPRRNPRKLSPFHLAHAAAVSDFAVALRFLGPEAGVRLLRWLREEDGWESWTSEGRDRGVCPDGVAVAEVEREGEFFEIGAFVEVDMGTMSQPRLRSKVLRYLRYANERRWESRWECCPPLLVAFGSEHRAATFLDGVARIRSGKLRNLGWTDSRDAAELVVAACSEVFDPDSAVCEPVWLTGPEAVPVRLADLLAATASSAAARRREREAEERRRAAAWRANELRNLYVKLRGYPGLGRSVAEATGEAFHADAVRAMLDRAFVDREFDLAWAEAYAPFAEELFGWSREDGPPTPALRAGLADAFSRVRREQAARVVEVADSLGVGTPAYSEQRYLRRAALALVRGRLVHDSRVWSFMERERLRSEDDYEESAARYRAAREASVDASLRQLGLLARARADREALGADYDRDHLLACDGCGADVAVHDGRRPERCPWCEGRLVSCDRRPSLPSTAEAVEELRRVAGGRG
jgi:hypothetical protein